MTFDEISAKWNKSSVNDNGSELTKRTFYNHCQAIARHFGIDIECRRGRGLNLYYITNPEAIEENSLTKWALDSFSLGELLLGNASISDKILLEDIPSGREWLEPVLYNHSNKIIWLILHTEISLALSLGAVSARYASNYSSVVGMLT